MSRVAVNTVLKATLSVLAARSVGFSADEISGYPSKRVGPVAEAMVKEGLLYRCKPVHRGLRYFASEALSSAFVSAQKEKPAKALLSPRTRATWAKDAPMNITADTKFTRAPSPPTGVFRSNTHSR
jgi:hypothetical protein